ncbi:amino acid adenylation domain-containing protein [Lentzea sp. NPDC058436]|uniref:hybrid non-ribosomal peptide synthetase/type I polyketide synthase n=1 Tax=Lentzea sp. NPDC058436 TaxID=3346499 RepID=UPI0036621D98
MNEGAIAVIGMAVRVPGARDLAGFWRNLRDGVESITRFTGEELMGEGVPAEEVAHPEYVPALGALDDLKGFDARLFGFAPREAQLLDPQHRLFLECAWEALEHAGCPSGTTGVYGGVGANTYFLNNLLPHQDLVARVGAFQTSLGNDKDFVPTRVSYLLNLRGPSVSVQTGCSTSLVAVHLAAQALLNGECDVALAGGATVLPWRRGYRFEPGGVLSPDGHCRAFDERAAGTVPASGAGVVVLKRLDSALADGDRIHAVLRGSAINNDGARKVGFTAPSVDGQADVITEALGIAEVDPSTVSYVEAHGTGTPLGDPIEVAALRAAFGTAGCALGSVKTNVGHLDTAAGVVGMIKTVLALRARALPPSLHFTRPNPRLGLDDGLFHVNAALTPWHGDVLRAGVSSFGIGGTNAHVVLEQAPARAGTTTGRRRAHVLPLSAATPTALDAAGKALAEHLRGNEERLDEVAYTLQRGRFTLPHRTFALGGTTVEAAAALDGLTPVTHETSTDRDVVFAFPGHGSQRAGMGQALYEREPVFRAAVDHAADLLVPRLGADIRTMLFTEPDPARINDIRYAQPCLFVIEHALARLWMSLGVRPAAMVGHSLGEFVAACLSGVMTLEDALEFVVARGELMHASPEGAMVAVPLPENEITPLLGPDLAIAAINAPHLCMVSGPPAAVAELEELLAAQEVETKRIVAEHPYHSPLMDDAAKAFEELVARVRLAPPRIPFASGVTGRWITDEEATSPRYWARHMRSTVRFADSLRTVSRPDAVVLEVGPCAVLTGLASGASVASMPSAGKKGDAETDLLTAAGELWCRGVSIDWEALHGETPPLRTELPTYPFERVECWIDPPSGTAPVSTSGLSVLGFRRVGPAIPGDAGPVLVVRTTDLATDRPFADQLIAREDDRTRIVAVVSGALDVTGEEQLEPALADLVAWARERPDRRKLVDVAGTPDLRAEIADRSEPVVALHGRHRFVPSLEPLRENPGRHDGEHYLVTGDERLAAAFERALTEAGATVSPHGPTALIVLDGDTGHLVQPPLARAVEVHVVGAGARIEAEVALIARVSDVPWTTYRWPDATAIGRRAASAVGTAPGTCHVLVDWRDDEEPAAETAPDHADETERVVAGIFADLLGVTDVGPAASFFELGGHSLLAARFVAEVRKACGVALSLRTFLDDPTVRGLAAAVRGAGGDVPLPVVVPDLAGAGEPFPMTELQQAYWIGRTGVFELGGVGMHGYEEFHLPDLDVPRLQQAFRKLVRRHGMLRVIVLPQGEQQILGDVPDYVIDTQDARGLPEHEALAAVERTRAAMSHQVFDPSRWPLFDLRATTTDSGTRLHFSIDGLITDAWAFRIIMRELRYLYDNPAAELPALALSFRDYMLAERALEETDAYRRAAKYWLDRVPDLALAPDLPLACDPRSIAVQRFSRVAGVLPAPEWARIRARAGDRGITPAALLATVYGEVLATWSKNRRFTLNLPMANRLPLHPEVDAIVGDFTSVTLLEVDADSRVPFEARARAVRDQLLTDIDHRVFSGVKVLREMKKARGDSTAVMPVIFTSLLLDDGDYNQFGETVHSISQTPQVWLDTQVYETGGALNLDMDSVDGLFPDGMVAAMHAAAMRLLHWLADETSWDSAVPSLVPAEDLASRETYNQTAGPLPSGLLHEPFFAIAARAPERPAVITPGRTLTYGELDARARGIAARLDVRPNELVAVVMEKGWEQCAAVLGVLAAGGAYLPIDPDLPDERVRFLLDHGEVRSVLTQARCDRPFGSRTVLVVDALPAEAGEIAPIATTPDDLAYVIFTSGSTGLPKGVMISHRGALNTVDDVNERFGVGGDDRVLALSSLSFDLSVYDVFGPLAVGGAVVVPDPAAHRDPAAWLDLMTSARVTVWNSVPALMELLVEHLDAPSDTALRLVMMSGDWIPVTLPGRIRELLGVPDVISLGGATEASIWSILHPIGEVPPDWTSVPYGRPMRNQTFHVLDDALRPRPTWVPGQLYIGGVGLADGYLRDEAKTAASFLVHPDTGERLYRTGDLGRFLPGGEIEFLGREDFQVKVQGHRIELGEIEAALLQHPGVRAAVVVVQGEQRGAKRLVAFVLPQHEMPDLTSYLGTKLPRYMVPNVFLEIAELPLTANGKVNRRALVVPDDPATGTSHHEAPRTPVEEAVAEVWRSMLDVERVGVHDDFFLLGGDSLMAMRAVVHLRRALGVEVPIQSLFDHPRLEDAAFAIEERMLAEIEDMTDEEAESLLEARG